MTQHLQTMMCEYTILIIMLYIGVRCLNQRNNKIIRSFSHFVFGVIAFQIINIPVRMVDAGLVRMPAAVVFVLNCGFMIAETFVTYEWFYFFESIQNSLFVEKKIIRALRSIPLVLMIVLCVVRGGQAGFSTWMIRACIAEEHCSHFRWYFHIPMYL